MAHLEREYEAASSYRPNKADWLEGAWAGLAAAAGDERRGETDVKPEVLQTVGAAITTGARRSTRTAGTSTVVVPITGLSGAVAGIAYLIRLVKNLGTVRPAERGSTTST